MDYLFIIDTLGVMAFTISGVLSAIKKRMDLFGIFIIAFVTAVGGGTIRDLLIDAPIVWMNDYFFMYTIAITTVFAIIFRKKLYYLRRGLFLFDTIGISLYTVIGVEKGIEAGFSSIICIAIGTISACFGGVVRDILCNEIPVIFREKDIYATACILGATAYFIMLNLNFPVNVIFVVSAIVVFSVRTLAVVFNIGLPNIYRNEA
ncbi:putative membrane protein YeiH [Mesonia hippocampi]|uniref:Putative membrane protein YeiH n=1 Tax=Mesonia hippocampi TaxID=1628250 RepID=A0A840EWC0_9FLAO|nr:trimeric intracellular cation channel family protein [Mesonia hippocampi]MBB4119137.1 putative membrane protein YeiH [Mesonia hippocampi]